jgi:cytochrome c biogenesis protein CcdA
MKIEIKYAIFLTMSNLGVLTIEWISERLGFQIGTHAWYLGLFFVPLILFLGMRKKREVNPNKSFSYLNAFGTGFLTTLFSSILTAILTFVYVRFFDIERQTKIIESMRQNLTNTGLSESQVSSQIESWKFIMSPMVMSFGAMLLMVMAGVFFSLISATFVRKSSTIQIQATSDIV